MFWRWRYRLSCRSRCHHADTGVFCLAAIIACSSLLMALAVLAAACLGARTGYSHACYSLAIFEPTLTVVIFPWWRHRLSSFAVSASRICAARENSRAYLTVGDQFRFSRLTVGRSADADTFARYQGRVLDAHYQTVIPSMAFSGLWAVALLGAGFWLFGQIAAGWSSSSPSSPVFISYSRVCETRRYSLFGAAGRVGDAGKRNRALDA